MNPKHKYLKNFNQKQQKKISYSKFDSDSLWTPSRLSYTEQNNPPPKNFDLPLIQTEPKQNDDLSQILLPNEVKELYSNDQQTYQQIEGIFDTQKQDIDRLMDGFLEQAVTMAEKSKSAIYQQID